MWLGAWEVPVLWEAILPEPLPANQAPVCRPIPQAPNPFPVSAAEWAEWRAVMDEALGVGRR